MKKGIAADMVFTLVLLILIMISVAIGSVLLCNKEENVFALCKLAKGLFSFTG